MWKTKIFKTKAMRDTWIEKNSNKYRIDEIIVCNGYGVEYKKLHIIRLK